MSSRGILTVANHRAFDRLYIARLVQLGELEPGRYDLVCRVLDRLKEESIVVREPFEVR